MSLPRLNNLREIAWSRFIANIKSRPSFFGLCRLNVSLVVKEKEIKTEAIYGAPRLETVSARCRDHKTENRATY